MLSLHPLCRRCEDEFTGHLLTALSAPFCTTTAQALRRCLPRGHSERQAAHSAKAEAASRARRLRKAATVTGVLPGRLLEGVAGWKGAGAVLGVAGSPGSSPSGARGVDMTLGTCLLSGGRVWAPSSMKLTCKAHRTHHIPQIVTQTYKYPSTCIHRPLDIYRVSERLTRLFRPAEPFQWGVAGSEPAPACSSREGPSTGFLGDADA